MIEFEEFDKKFPHNSLICEVGIDPFRDKEDCNCYKKDLKQFISQHFLPKSKVREMTDKLWDKVPKDCDEYSYHRGLNDLVSNVMDLDL